MRRHRGDKARPTSKEFRFNRNYSIGQNDAVDDGEFLEDVFIDIGLLEIIEDVKSKKWILVGRTGSGKSALLEQLSLSEDSSIKIEPESLALNYLSNNKLLNYFSEIGVYLDPFYNLLWKHVFITEIIRQRYKFNENTSKGAILDKLSHIVNRDEAKKEAVKYWLEFGDKFWISTEQAVHEFTKGVEHNASHSLDASLKAKLMGILDVSGGAKAEGSEKITESEKQEIIDKGRDVVSKLQMKKINDLIGLIDSDILEDEQRPIYISIDDLDRNWVEGNIKYRLIKSLIESAKDMNNKIRNLKIVIALREDLVERVFRAVHDEGFQEEKYESLYLNLQWNEKELEDMLDQRVKKLVRDKNHSRVLGVRDVITNKMNQSEDPIEYMIKRTMLRPRDLIS